MAELSEMTNAELRDKAEALGLEVNARMRKAELVALIEGATRELVVDESEQEEGERALRDVTYEFVQDAPERGYFAGDQVYNWPKRSIQKYLDSGHLRLVG